LTTQGGDEIELEGSNFGPVGEAGVIVAWSIPASLPSAYTSLSSWLVFPALNCSVIQDHVLMRCFTTGGVGGALTWRVSIEGQNSTVPKSSYGYPTINSVTLLSSRVSTLGGALIRFTGMNFGSMSSVVSGNVWFGSVSTGTIHTGGVQLPSYAGLSATLVNCSVVSQHTAIVCALPAGVGRISKLSLTVLDQSTSFTPANLSYDAPVVSSTNPNPFVLPTDVRNGISLSGSGFGWTVASVAVWLTANTSGLCGSTGALTVIQPAVVEVKSDSSIVVGLNSWSFLYRNGWMSVFVAGQRVTNGDIGFTVTPPTIQSLSFSATRPNSSLYYLDIVGDNFGTVLESGASDHCLMPGIVVRIDTASCLSLRITVPHKQLQCVTDLSVGMLHVRTGAGSVSMMYNSSVLSQPAEITSVTPSVWNTTGGTMLSMTGVRFGAHGPVEGYVLLRRVGITSDAVTVTRCPSLADVKCYFDGVVNGANVTGSYTDSGVVCMVEGGVGKKFRAYVHNAWSLLPAAVGFSGPVITNVSPDGIGVAGGLLTISGSGFGGYGCDLAADSVVTLTYLITAPVPTFSVAGSGFLGVSSRQANCEVVTWSENVITCTAPATTDVLTSVMVIAGNQTSSRSVSHARPDVVSILNGTEAATKGGTVTTVFGSGFGYSVWPLVVVIGGVRATVLSHNSSAAQVAIPPGCNVGVSLRAFTLIGGSPVVDLVDYAAPRITNITTPGSRPCYGQFPLIIHAEVSVVRCFHRRCYGNHVFGW
jgi:hypothetical protein